VDNVVNYTVVVTLENPDGKLLPGMTARVDFFVKSAVGVLKVANAALRYKPSDEVLAQLGVTPASGEATSASGSDPTPMTGSGSEAMRARRAQGSGSGNGVGTLYSLDPHGKLQVLRIHTGISDGASTEVQGPLLSEGMKVIDGLASTKAAASQVPAVNPLGVAQQGAAGRGRGGGGF
jgi:HlyD family secretion protein